jgi:hypothetical protein
MTIDNRINQALEILAELGFPRGQLNELVCSEDFSPMILMRTKVLTTNSFDYGQFNIMLRYTIHIAFAGIEMPYTMMQPVLLTGNCRSHSVNQISKPDK